MTSAPSISNIAATTRLTPIFPVRSPIKPAAKGPSVWEIANITVNRLIVPPHLSGGKFWRVKLVIAPGAINTDRPNMIVEKIKDESPGKITGKAEPIDIQLSIIANGLPEEWRARMPRQMNGERQMLDPRRPQVNEIKLELEACSVIQAERNVR